MVARAPDSHIITAYMRSDVSAYAYLSRASAIHVRYCLSVAASGDAVGFVLGAGVADAAGFAAGAGGAAGPVAQAVSAKAAQSVIR
jgi:hypothetical protein